MPSTKFSSKIYPRELVFPRCYVKKATNRIYQARGWLNGIKIWKETFVKSCIWSGYHALPSSKHVSENDMIAWLLHNAMAYLVNLRDNHFDGDLSMRDPMVIISRVNINTQHRPTLI